MLSSSEEYDWEDFNKLFNKDDLLRLLAASLKNADRVDLARLSSNYDQVGKQSMELQRKVMKYQMKQSQTKNIVRSVA
jgi:hypothetical protein